MRVWIHVICISKDSQIKAYHNYLRLVIYFMFQCYVLFSILYFVHKRCSILLFSSYTCVLIICIAFSEGIVLLACLLCTCPCGKVKVSRSNMSAFCTLKCLVQILVCSFLQNVCFMSVLCVLRIRWWTKQEPPSSKF